MPPAASAHLFESRQEFRQELAGLDLSALLWGLRRGVQCHLPHLPICLLQAVDESLRVTPVGHHGDLAAMRSDAVAHCVAVVVDRAEAAVCERVRVESRGGDDDVAQLGHSCTAEEWVGARLQPQVRVR